MKKDYVLYYVNCKTASGKRLKKFLECREDCFWRGFIRGKNGCYFYIPTKLLKDINITSKGNIYVEGKELYGKY